MRAVIRHIMSPGIPDLSRFVPECPDSFSLFVQILVGPLDEEGEESFDITILTPRWLLENESEETIVMGRHKLIVFKFDYAAIKNWIEKYVSACSGSNWEEVAEKIARLGSWEFEDYRPYVGPSGME